MQICIATDKFKGSLTSIEAATALKEGFKSVFMDSDCTIVPMADGGDGSIAILRKVVPGRMIYVPAFDALKRSIEAPLYIFNGGGSAFIESATVCGLAMLDMSDRNPEISTSYGLGILIRRALDEGVGKIYVGLGGTATNDAGTGMMKALGCRYLDERGEEIPEGCLGLDSLSSIDDSELDARFRSVRVYAVTDVSNPLLGEEGATYTYALQKGASRKRLPVLEGAMKRFAEVYEKEYGRSIASMEGGGAAGGIGAMLLSQKKSFRIEGWRFFAELQHLESVISHSDLVVSGEGKFDVQSLSGKVIDGVEELCREHAKPLWVFCGKSELKDGHLAVCPSIEHVFKISDIEMSTSVSIKYADKLLKELATLAARTLL